VLEQKGPEVKRRTLQLLRASALLEEFFQISYSNNLVLGPAVVRRLKDIASNHSALMRAAGCKLVPKHHWFYELARGSARNGNSLHSSTYPDETLNHVIANIGKGVHARTFGVSVLKKVRVLMLCRGVPA
jgi:hypothetical protein